MTDAQQQLSIENPYEYINIVDGNYKVHSMCSTFNEDDESSLPTVTISIVQCDMTIFPDMKTLYREIANRVDAIECQDFYNWKVENETLITNLLLYRNKVAVANRRGTANTLIMHSEAYGYFFKYQAVIEWLWRGDTRIIIDDDCPKNKVLIGYEPFDEKNPISNKLSKSIMVWDDNGETMIGLLEGKVLANWCVFELSGVKIPFEEEEYEPWIHPLFGKII